MITCEERAMERILSLGFCDTAIPISIRQSVTGHAEICVLPSLKKTALEFEKLFSGNLFSKQAHLWLYQRVRPFMHSLGYHDNRQSRKITKIFTRPLGKEGLDSSGSVILTEPMKNITTADLPSLLEFGHTVAAVVQNDTVVCVAYTNLPPEGDAVEIGVECAPEYRNRGFARSALSALIAELERSGITPVYVCSVSNRASLRLAISLGFELEATEYNYVFRRN